MLSDPTTLTPFMLSLEEWLMANSHVRPQQLRQRLVAAAPEEAGKTWLRQAMSGDWTHQCLYNKLVARLGPDHKDVIRTQFTEKRFPTHAPPAQLDVFFTA
jgi:hypothetical protein